MIHASKLRCSVFNMAGLPMTFLVLIILTLPRSFAADWIVETVAGTGEKGYSGDGGPAIRAQINNPYGLVIGPDRGLYFCDIDNHVIRRIADDGTITTIAGSGKAGYSGDGGAATDALLNQPYEIRFDGDGNIFFVEMPNHLVRKVDLESGLISTIAGTGKAGFSGDGGPAIHATFHRPHSIQFDTWGNLLICDIGNHRIRRVGKSNGMVETLSGTGETKATPEGAPLFQTPLNGPRALDVAPDGDLWLALREGNAVYRIDMKKGRFHHVAGSGKKGFTGNGGPAKLATLSGPKGISLDAAGNVWLADTESHSVRMIDMQSGNLELIAGNGARGDGPDGDPLKCQLARPHGIFAAVDGSVYIGDSENHRIRRLRNKAASR
jgi:streptogramin lyase